jgi:very-short-patch-repair endonuclease
MKNIVPPCSRGVYHMDEKIFNNPRIEGKRKKLRNDMTGAERKLWCYLRRRSVCGMKFRRQFSIDSYIVDFYCPEIRLAIEVDGDTHLTKDEMVYDKERQNEIEKLGIEFLRFVNGEIYNDIDSVMERIKTKIKDLIL